MLEGEVWGSVSRWPPWQGVGEVVGGFAAAVEGTIVCGDAIVYTQRRILTAQI